MEKSKTKIFLIVASATALVSLLALIGLFYLIQIKNNNLYSIEEELALLEKDEEAGSTMKRLLADTKERRDNLNNYFVGKDNVVSFIETIEALSRQVKVETTVNSVGVEQGNAGENFEYVTVNALSEGSFDGLYWLLTLIESMPLKIEVNKVYIEEVPVDARAKETKWKLAFVIKVLKLK